MEEKIPEKNIIKREFSAGGVVYKKIKNSKGKKENVFWLVTRSSPSKKYPKSIWRLPKGWLDDEEGGIPGPFARGEVKSSEEEIQKAAIREVREEAGVLAKVAGKIGTEKYFLSQMWGKTLKFVTFYLMEWIADYPKGPGFETEKIEWLPYSQARRRLHYSGEKKVLDKAKKLLERLKRT